MADDHTADLVARADVCVVAIAECFRGDGEILANPIGTIPMIGGRLARATFEPDLAMTDGEARLIANDEAFEWPDGKVVETSTRTGQMFDVGLERTSPRDDGRHPDRPVRQPELRRHRRLQAARRCSCSATAARRATRSTTRRSYWVPNHSPKVLCATVDTVCGIGYDRAAELGPDAARFHEIRRVVTNLAVLDFETPDHRMRLRSVHPGVTVDEVQAATGFELVVPDDVPDLPAADTRRARADRTVIDPKGLRLHEVPN